MNIRKKNMKGQLAEMPTAVITLVLIAIVAAVGLLILSSFQATAGVQTNTCIGTNTMNTLVGLCGQGGVGVAANTIIGASYNSVGQGVTGVSTITSFLSLIALVIVAAIVIGLVVYAFARGGGGSEKF